MKKLLLVIAMLVLLLIAYRDLTVNKYEYMLFVYNNETDLVVMDAQGFNNKTDCVTAGKMIKKPFECGYKCRVEYGRNICEETLK